MQVARHLNDLFNKAIKVSNGAENNPIIIEAGYKHSESYRSKTQWTKALQFSNN